MEQNVEIVNDGGVNTSSMNRKARSANRQLLFLIALNTFAISATSTAATLAARFHANHTNVQIPLEEFFESETPDHVDLKYSSHICMPTSSLNTSLLRTLLLINSFWLLVCRNITFVTFFKFFVCVFFSLNYGLKHCRSCHRLTKKSNCSRPIHVKNWNRNWFWEQKSTFPQHWEPLHVHILNVSGQHKTQQ